MAVPMAANLATGVQADAESSSDMVIKIDEGCDTEISIHANIYVDTEISIHAYIYVLIISYDWLLILFVHELFWFIIIIIITIMHDLVLPSISLSVSLVQSLVFDDYFSPWFSDIY